MSLPPEIDFDAYRDPALARELISRIHDIVGDRRINLMEVCGTHTMSIGRYGFRSIMPDGLKLLSGPGCPVCVTPNADIDRAIAIAGMEGVAVATFGDMLRVPGSAGSLAEAKSHGADVRIVYSALDALDLARREPGLDVVFIGVGFETTSPTVAATLLEARDEGIRNFSVLCAHKTTPPALRAIAGDPAARIDGFILPGHVSTITGLAPYRFLVDEFGIPGVVAGFEPVDILQAVAELSLMVVEGRPAIANAYRRGVDGDGNPVARALVDEAFEPIDADWRGLGTIPASGLRIRPALSHLDAAARHPVRIEPSREAPGCRCGDILRGASSPCDCPLFDRACTPEHPVGPCMVSSEGSCAAYHRYRA